MVHTLHAFLNTLYMAQHVACLRIKQHSSSDTAQQHSVAATHDSRMQQAQQLVQLLLLLLLQPPPLLDGMQRPEREATAQASLS
jgi:hypothetical protein